MRSITWHIPCFAHGAIIMGYTQTVTTAPPQVQRTYHLSVYAKQQFAPVLITFRASGLKISRTFPHRVFKYGMPHINAVIGIAISQTNKHAVTRMLIVHNIHICTNTEVRRVCFITDIRNFILLMISSSIPYFQDWEILVVQIQTECSLILTVVTKLHLRQSYQIERYGKATKQRNRVFLQFQEALCICPSRSSKKQH